MQEVLNKIGMLDPEDDKYIRDGALWDACRMCFRRLENLAPLAQEHMVVRATEKAVEQEHNRLIQ